MKKFMKGCAILMASLMVLSTTAFAEETEAAAAGEEIPVEVVDLSDKGFKVGFAQDTLNQPWRANQADCVVKAFAKYGIECEVTDGGGSSETQISNIEDMVVGGLDLLIVSPAQEAALTSTVEEVYNSGIPVVCIDRGITSDGRTCFVHGDNYKMGIMVADWIAEKLTEKYGEPKGNIVLLEGVAGATTTVQRSDGFLGRIEEAYPDMKIIVNQPADFNRATAMSLMEDALQTYDQIDAVFTEADESTMGALAAIENADRRDEILITSVNGTTEGIEAIVDGRMDMTVMYTNCSGPGVDMACKILQGEEVPSDITIDPFIVDASNAEEYYNEGTYSPDPMELSASTYTVTW